MELGLHSPSKRKLLYPSKENDCAKEVRHRDRDTFSKSPKVNEKGGNVMEEKIEYSGFLAVLPIKIVNKMFRMRH